MTTHDSSAAHPPDGGAPGSDVSSEQFRSALGRHPAGVVIITMDPGTGPVGFTATSLASISLDPPLVSFNIAQASSSIDAVHEADSVIVHMLGSHQRQLARRFAGPAAQRFADEAIWSRLNTGEPLLHDTPLWLRAGIERLVPVGDHTLVIARVHEVRSENEGAESADPLVYHRGRYHRPTPLD